MSRLEKFIRDNRDAFDDEMPSAALWQKLGTAVPSKQPPVVSLNPVVKWSMAASVLLLTIVSVFLLTRKTDAPGIPAATINSDTATGDIAAAMPEAAVEVSQFAKLIALKQEELKVLSKEQPELYQTFAADINQLDSLYRTLKLQLNAASNREMLIEAMIQNLQLQLKVLNQQLHIIHQVKQSKKYSHEKNKNFM
jgi:hypothetical protein